jgi:hypothetical protein
VYKASRALLTFFSQHDRNLSAEDCRYQPRARGFGLALTLEIAEAGGAFNFVATLTHNKQVMTSVASGSKDILAIARDERATQRHSASSEAKYTASGAIYVWP